MRDSGLLCRELQKMGIGSKVVLPGPAYPDDDADVLRPTRREIESPAWWRSLQIDGVIMVAWARHIDTPIIRAITAAGLPVVEHIDGSGSAFPLLHQADTLKTIWRTQQEVARHFLGRVFLCLKRSVRVALAQAVKHTYLRYRHLCQATVATFQTPTSYERNAQLCRLFGGSRHKARLAHVGYPVPSDFFWDPCIAKEQRIVSIGRWNSLAQKRPFLLMAVCGQIARRRPGLEIDIFGRPTPALQQWHAGLEPDLQARIHLHGIHSAEVVGRALQKAQITFFPSSVEGGPQALFEGLACGATTVGFDSPDMPGTRWAAACGHGELVRKDAAENYVDALDRELEKWASGHYSPGQISEYWRPFTQAREVLRKMLRAATGEEFSCSKQTIR